MKMTRSKYLAFALAVFTLGASLPADATAKQRSINVEYRDLNLADAKGRRALDRRIERAVVQLCGSTNMARNMAEIRMVEACTAEAHNSSAPSRARAEARAAQRMASTSVSGARN
jgi:UrcA family protein